MAKISNNDIAYAIYSSLKGKEGIEMDTTIENSVRFLADQRLLSQSELILSKVQELRDKDKGVIRAQVTSAKKLTEPSRAEITKHLKNKYGSQEIVLEEHLDANLISGVKIEIGEEIIDISLKNKIEQLHDYLIKN